MDARLINNRRTHEIFKQVIFLFSLFVIAFAVAVEARRRGRHGDGYGGSSGNMNGAPILQFIIYISQENQTTALQLLI